MTQTHFPLYGSERRLLPGAVAVGRANANAVIEVSLKLKRKAALPPLTERPTEILTRERLAETYGASQADVDKVSQVFAGFGLQTIASHPGTRTLKLRGTIAAMERAFDVRLFRYSHPEGGYRGRVGSINVPEEVKDLVKGVFGLDNRRVAHRRRRGARDASSPHSSVPAAWYIPSELATRYKFPAGDGSGQTIALLEFGGGYFPADLKQFCSLANIAAPPSVTPISVDGTATDSTDDTVTEVMLDIEVLAGICEKSKIVVYFASFGEQGWIAALDAVVRDKVNAPRVLSISWGAPEDGEFWTQQGQSQIDESLQELAHLGVTVCVASGDDGSSDGVTDGLAHVDYPGSSPYVLSVGGTTILSKGSTQPDVVWKEADGLTADQHGSTGGGVSAKYPRPTWQNGINIAPVNPGAIIGRCVPDVSVNADWTVSPYLLVANGSPQSNGGTSAASPLVAALITLINAQRPATNPVGWLTPVLYKPSSTAGLTIGAAGCTDVSSGDNITAHNGGFKASPGYDAASGWGTPIGTRLMQELP